MESIQAKPMYIPLIQKPMCCNVTCTQMVLLRHGITPPLQDDIAKSIGVRIPKENRKSFMRKLIMPSKPPYGTDTITKKNEKRYNNFFEKSGLPFRVRIFMVSKIKNRKKFIVDNMKDGNDIHVEVCMKPITGVMSCHDMLISKISCGKRCAVKLIDPWWTNKQFHVLDLKTLLNSMDKKWFKRDLGFMIYYRK